MAELSEKTEFLDALDRCIAEVRAGRLTIEECLEAYPGHQAELAPLLAAALAIVPLSVTPDPAQKLRARYAFVEALHSEKSAKPSVLDAFGGLRRRLAGVAAATFLAIAGSSAAVVAAQDAQPSDPLYGLKTAVEQQQVAFAASPDARAELRVRIADRRLAEAERAIAAGRLQDALAAAAAYAQTIQNAYEDIDAALGAGSSSVDASEAADGSLARVSDVAAKARLAGEQAAAAALLEAREHAQRDRPPTRRGVPAQPAAPAPVAEVRELVVPTQVVEATDEPAISELEAPAPATAAVTAPPTQVQVAPAQPTRPPTGGNPTQSGAGQANANQGRSSGPGREDNRQNDQDDDRRDRDPARGEGNEGPARSSSPAQPTAPLPAANTIATPTPRSAIAPTAERDNRDGGNDRGGNGREKDDRGNGRGDDDRRDRGSPTQAPTAVARGVGNSADRARPTATPTPRSASATPAPGRSGSSGSSGDGDRDGNRDERDGRDGNRGTDRN